MPYCNSTDLLTWSRFTKGDFGSTGYNYESTLEMLIKTADRAIDDYCLQPAGFFEPGGVEVVRESHSGVEVGYYGLYPSFGVYSLSRRPFLRLKYAPVLSVTAFEEETSAGTWTSRTEGRSSDFVVVDDGIRVFGNTPKYDYDNLRVTYVAGYLDTPGRVSECSARLASAYGHAVLDARIRQPSGTGDLSVTPTETAGLTSLIFTEELKTLVKRFKRHVPVQVVKG